MGMDEFSRLMAELQGAASEVLSCRMAGRKSDEAEEQFRKTVDRSRSAAVEYRVCAARIDVAVETAEAAMGAATPRTGPVATEFDPSKAYVEYRS